MSREDLDFVIHEDMKRLVKAQALSARRGGCPIDLTQTIARQVAWLRASDATFKQWIDLTEQSGQLFLEWYDWYSGIKTAPEVELEPKLELVR